MLYSFNSEPAEVKENSTPELKEGMTVVVERAQDKMQRTIQRKQPPINSPSLFIKLNQSVLDKAQ